MQPVFLRFLMKSARSLSSAQPPRYCAYCEVSPEGKRGITGAISAFMRKCAKDSERRFCWTLNGPPGTAHWKRSPNFCEAEGAFLSETEFTGLIVEHAKRIGSTFEKVYCGSGADGIELRKAVARCRDEAFAKAGVLMSLMPTQTDSLQAAQDVGGKSGGAYEQLMAMAEKMKAASPELTLAQCF
jgi:hypothetical protein